MKALKILLNQKNKTLLSFDDGLKDHYYAYKILLKYGFKGIFFSFHLIHI